VDPWFYLGYMLDLPRQIHAFPDLYYGSRLSWLLPGYLLYQSFPPLEANYLLHLLACYASVFAVFFTLRTTVGTNVAVTTTILLCSYFGFLLAVGWDYVDGAGIAYLSLTNLGLVKSAGSRHWAAWLALSGFTFSAACSANVFVAVFVPVIALTYAATNRYRTVRQHIVGIGSSLLGAGMLVGLLGVANYAMGGDFLYFRPSLRFASSSLQQPNQFHFADLDLFAWILDFPPLTLPALMVIVCTGLVFAVRRGSAITATRLFHTSFLAAAVIMLGTEVLASQPALEYAYYVSYLVPWLFLAVGGSSVPIVAKFRWRQLAFVLAATAAGSLLAATHRLDAFAVSDLRTPLLVGVAAVAGSALVCSLRPRFTFRGTANVTLAAAVVFAASFGAWSFRALDEARIGPAVYVGDAVRGEDSADGFATVVDANKFLRSIDPEAGIWLWYDHDAVEGGLYRAIASTYLWGYRLVGERFPELGGPPFGGVSVQLALVPHRQIAILSDHNDAVEQARPMLAEYGLGPTFEYQARIQHGEHSVVIAVAQLVPLGLAAGPPASWVADWTQGWEPASQAVVKALGPTEVEVQTKPSKYDWQLVSDPIPVHPRSKYMIRMQLQVKAGGVGISVVDPDLTVAPVVLGMQFWDRTTPDVSQYAQEGYVFETGDTEQVRVVVSNGSLPDPAESTFRIRELGLWEQSDGA
jgi:hypothetical protein